MIIFDSASPHGSTRPIHTAKAPAPRQHVVLQFRGARMSVVFETAALRDASPAIREQHKVPSFWSSWSTKSRPVVEL